MKYQPGDHILATANAQVMNLNVLFPLKAIIIGQVPPPPTDPNTEYYSIQIEFNKDQISQLRRNHGWDSDHIPTRFTYSSKLLKRDKYCPVCRKVIETYSSRDLISVHGLNGEICYGSHSPLDF